MQSSYSRSISECFVYFFNLGSQLFELSGSFPVKPLSRAYRRLVKEKDAGKPLDPVIDKMNKMAQEYYDNSRPYCAQQGFVDEISGMGDIRKDLSAFAGSVYLNPKSICPQHQMILPRSIRG